VCLLHAAQCELSASYMTRTAALYVTLVCGRYLSSEVAFTDDRPVGVIQQYLSEWTFSLKHSLSRLLFPCFGRHHGNYLVTLYLLVKLLYIGNVVGQLFMLNALLGASYHSYGVDVINAMMNGTDWTSSPIFPRVTLCDFRARIRSPTRHHTPHFSVVALSLTLRTITAALAGQVAISFLPNTACLTYLIILWLLKVRLSVSGDFY